MVSRCRDSFSALVRCPGTGPLSGTAVMFFINGPVSNWRLSIGAGKKIQIFSNFSLKRHLSNPKTYSVAQYCSSEQTIHITHFTADMLASRRLQSTLRRAQVRYRSDEIGDPSTRLLTPKHSTLGLSPHLQTLQHRSHQSSNRVFLHTQSLLRSSPVLRKCSMTSH